MSLRWKFTLKYTNFWDFVPVRILYTERHSWNSVLESVFLSCNCFFIFFFLLSHLIPLFLTLLFPLYALKNTDKDGRKDLRANHLCGGDPFTTEKFTSCVEKLQSLYPKCSFYLKITTTNFCAISVYIFSNLGFFFNWSSWNAIIKTSGI